MLNSYIQIEVLSGGFVLTYPTIADNGTVDGEEREVFVSPRKLNQKLKDVIESLSLVGEDKE